MIDLTSALAGAGVAGGLLAFGGTWLFATKSEVQRAEARSAAALAQHDKDDADRRDSMMRRLFDKMDKMTESLNDLRVKVEGLKYSRTGAKRTDERPPGSDSDAFPRS